MTSSLSHGQGWVGCNRANARWVPLRKEKPAGGAASAPQKAADGWESSEGDVTPDQMWDDEPDLDDIMSGDGGML